MRFDLCGGAVDLGDYEARYVEQRRSSDGEPLDVLRGGGVEPKENITLPIEGGPCGAAIAGAFELPTLRPTVGFLPGDDGVVSDSDSSVLGVVRIPEEGETMECVNCLLLRSSQMLLFSA